MPDLSILIKPSSGMCNIDCAYCFYKALLGGESKQNFISLDIAEELIKKALEFSEKNLYFAFQGGEPTLIGKEFYEKFDLLVKKHNTKNVKVHYAFQTNGILLDDEWCAFFHEHDFLIGLSLDGIEDVHDRYRVGYKKEKTFGKVIDSLKLLQKHGVRYNVLTVVTNDLAKRPNEYFYNIQSLGVRHVQLLECLDALSLGPGSSSFSLDPDNYGRFLVDLFDAWKSTLGTERFVHINYFENLIAMLLGQCPNDCGMFGYCSSQFVVEANGDVFPCDFYVLPKYRLGNIKEDGFMDMKRSKVAQSFESESFELDYDCGSCRYVKLCRGGCRRAREHKGQLTKTFLCNANKYFFDNRISDLVDIAKQVASGKYRTND